LAYVPPSHALSVEEERDYVGRAALGEQEAVGRLYDAYIARLYRYCFARVATVEDAEDLSEEIFLKVLGAIDGFEWRTLGPDGDARTQSPFGAWVFRIAYNHVASFHRRAANRTHTSDVPEWLEDGDRGPQELVETRLTIREVFAAVEQLPEAQREVIRLRFGAGLTIAETAEALGKQQTNVKVLQHKGVKRLKEMLLEAAEPPRQSQSAG
jgi:RNA polymerase sigma-70 factor (ECF subfamily)